MWTATAICTHLTCTDFGSSFYLFLHHYMIIKCSSNLKYQSSLLYMRMRINCSQALLDEPAINHSYTNSPRPHLASILHSLNFLLALEAASFIFSGVTPCAETTDSMIAWHSVILSIQFLSFHSVCKSYLTEAIGIEFHNAYKPNWLPEFVVHQWSLIPVLPFIQHSSYHNSTSQITAKTLLSHFGCSCQTWLMLLWAIYLHIEPHSTSLKPVMPCRWLCFVTLSHMSTLPQHGDAQC